MKSASVWSKRIRNPPDRYKPENDGPFLDDFKEEEYDTDDDGSSASDSDSESESEAPDTSDDDFIDNCTNETNEYNESDTDELWDSGSPDTSPDDSFDDSSGSDEDYEKLTPAFAKLKLKD
jgi:hypothetical protein